MVLFHYRPHRSNEFYPEFRSIRLGDLNLLSEVGKEDVIEYRDVRRRKTGALVQRVKIVAGTRKILQVRIFGSQETMTAVIQDGPDFEKEGGYFRSFISTHFLLVNSGKMMWSSVRLTGESSFDASRNF
jgi:hypothetical protein